MSDENAKPIDPADLPLFEIFGRYPVGKLLSVAGTVFAAGLGAGFFVKERLSSEELRHCETEYRTLEKQAGTLQQAIAAGNCVKSDWLTKRDEARRLLGRLDIAERGAAQVKEAILEGTGLQGVGIDADYWNSINLGAFLDDASVADRVSQLNIATLRLNESLPSSYGVVNTLESIRKNNEIRRAKGQPDEDATHEEAILRLAKKRFTEFDAALISAREYLKAKYLMADTRP